MVVTFQSAVRFCEKNPDAIFGSGCFLEPSKCGSCSNVRPHATPSGRDGALIRRKRSNYSDLTRPHPKWWFSKGNPLISGKSGLVKYCNLTRSFSGFSGNSCQAEAGSLWHWLCFQGAKNVFLRGTNGRWYRWQLNIFFGIFTSS